MSILDQVQFIIPKQSRKIIMVDAESGPYFEIQDAVQAASPGCVIQVGGGLYSQNVYIDQPDLTIQPKDKNSEIILLVQSKPSILINMKKENHQFTIRGIQVCHNAIETQEEFIEQETTAIVPGIIANENSRLIMNETEIWGHQQSETVGIILKKANADIYNSKVIHHIMGGILILADPQNRIQIVCNRISLNQSQGIHIVGDGKVVFESNLMEQNGIAIKIGLRNESELKHNEIVNNNLGIEITSATPIVSNNQIDKNQIGVHTLTYAPEMKSSSQEGVGKAPKIIVCAPTIKNNYIVSSEDMGILCSGEYNQSQIEDNYLIAYNNLCGIQVDRGAHPYIGNKNQIVKNFTYGILISDGGSAMIEKNDICKNIRANIVIGGKNSDLVIIKDNLISESKFDGICAIECNEALIKHNKISLNFNGIVCNKSFPLLEENRIYQNQGTGVYLVNESFPTLRDNVVTDNDNIGIYLKQEVNLQEEALNKKKQKQKELEIKQKHSNCLAEQNHVKFNELQVVQLDPDSPFNFDLFKQNNEVVGELRQPQLRVCNIF